MDRNNQRARDVYQRLLDEIGEAVIVEDKDRYTENFLLPHCLQTLDKSFDIQTVLELENLFFKMVERLKKFDVIELTRWCTVANFVDAKTIRGCHETRLINRNFVIVEDYIALSTLTLVDGMWKVSSSQYAEPNPSIPTQVTK
jgi:hypothetical protein